MAYDPLAPHEEIIDTALQPDDDSPDTSDDGYTFNRPSFDELDMLTTLEDPPIDEPQAELPPQEAYDLMKFSAPLDEEEVAILEMTPFLQPEGGLSFVDDADHAEWLMNRMREKRGAMDTVLEDAMYGEDMFDELGWSIPGSKYLKKAITAPLSLAKRAALAPLSITKALVKKFVPGRDAQKAALVKQTNLRLVNGRANFLQMADIRRGIKGRPRAAYVAQAKPWARSKLAAGGLPTTFTSGEVAATILGEDDMMGAWWNPFSWFQTKTKYVVQNAQGEMAEMNPTEFNQWVAQQQAAAADPNAAAAMQQQAMMDPSMQQQMDPSMMDPSMQQMDPSMMDPYAQQQMDPTAYASGDMDRWERDIDLHSWIEDATRGKRDGLVKLQTVAKRAAAGDKTAAADMNEIRNYQKQIGVNVMGEESDIIIGEAEYDFMVGSEDTAGAFSDFAGDVLGETRAERAQRAGAAAAPRGRWISADKYRGLTLRAARQATGKQNPPPAAVAGAHDRLINKVAARGIEVRGDGGESMMGAKLYKLSPRYWFFTTKRERQLIDAEKQNWQKAKDLTDESKIAERAAYQAEQAAAASAKSKELQARLDEAEKAISSGDFVGADPTAAVEAAQNGQAMAAKNARRADALVAKIESGEKLSPEEIGRLRGCLKMCRHLTALHNQLHAQTSATSSSGYHDFRMAKNTQSNFLGQNVEEILGGESRAEILGAAPTASTVPAHYHLVAMTALAATKPGGVMPYAKQHGIKLSASDVAKIKAAADRSKWIMKQPAYSQAKISGTDMMGADAMGFSWSKLITAPMAIAALPAAATAWAVQKTGLPGSATLAKALRLPVSLSQAIAKKGGWGGQLGVPGNAPAAPAPYPGAPGYQAAPGYPGMVAPGVPGAPGMYANPAARNAAIMAARQRQLAAQARINAAASQSAAAQQQYAAEAAAADAEAAAQEAEMMAQQSQAEAAMPDAYAYDEYSDSSGAESSSGRVTVLGADYFSGAFVGEIENEKAKKIVVAAQKNTPTGKKIRAGATLYSKAKKGDKKSRLAIAKIQTKAKTGDKQAAADLNAVKAGKIAVHAKSKAKWKIALKAKKEAANKKGIAVRKNAEANAGKRLGEHTRRKKLANIAKVEHLAAKGNPKAKAAVAKCVAAAHAGNPKAKTTVAALQLARHVRKAGNTPAEKKRLHAAHKVVYKARRGNKQAIRTIALIDAAAKKGQPNAVRAKGRLNVAAKVERAVATGKITPPTTKAKQQAAAKKQILLVRNRVSTGIATREEALGAAKLAKSIGWNKNAASLSLYASKLPSATQPIKNAAAVAAAAKNGSADAKAIVDRTLQGAQSGDPKAINGAGKLAAAQAVDAVNKGRPMPKPIAEATLIVERAHAGDPEAKRTVQRAGAAAQDPNHPNHDRAVEAAVALTAASAVLAATAANSSANKHWRATARKATGQHIESGEQAAAEQELAELVAKLHQGTGTYRDGLRARNLAVSLGKTKLAAEISAIMPPRDTADSLMSSLPDGPQPEITGPFGLIRESLKALLLATADPFGNWREGVQSRGG